MPHNWKPLNQLKITEKSSIKKRDAFLPLSEVTKYLWITGNKDGDSIVLAWWLSKLKNFSSSLWNGQLTM